MHRVVGCCVETNNTAAKRGGGETNEYPCVRSGGKQQTNYVCVCVCEFTQISPTVWAVRQILALVPVDSSPLIRVTNSIKAGGNESTNFRIKKNEIFAWWNPRQSLAKTITYTPKCYFKTILPSREGGRAKRGGKLSSLFCPAATEYVLRDTSKNGSQTRTAESPTDDWPLHTTLHQ
jgi:hypothetical protein